MPYYGLFTHEHIFVRLIHLVFRWSLQRTNVSIIVLRYLFLESLYSTYG
jgi:hypothetical protein